MTPRYHLYTKPARRAPRWWPRENGRVRWVGVLAGGVGWFAGDGAVMTSKQANEAREVFASEQVDDRGRRYKFVFRKERIK